MPFQRKRVQFLLQILLDLTQDHEHRTMAHAWPERRGSRCHYGIIRACHLSLIWWTDRALTLILRDCRGDIDSGIRIRYSFEKPPIRRECENSANLLPIVIRHLIHFAAMALFLSLLSSPIRRFLWTMLGSYIRIYGF